jgi:hypothetical protein
LNFDKKIFKLKNILFHDISFDLGFSLAENMAPTTGILLGIEK